MKDFVLELIREKKSHNEKLNLMREYLQAYVLRIMHDAGFFRTTAFIGGTALRFLHSAPRFSEDLDFSLEGEQHIAFSQLLKKINSELSAAGYQVSVTAEKEKTVNSAFVRFESLLFEAGLSSHRDQKFSVKIEIDVNPPKGAVLRTQVVNRYFLISFLSYDTASLFAGKLHALLTRKYTKGRDFFDVGWYLSKWGNLEPNVLLLRNALKQTGWKGTMPTKENWRQPLYEVIQKANWSRVRQDVGNFLENPKDLDILTKENILSLLKKRDS
ncbi:MAG: nucleotidyl transferase AbiEii/AbiGii toxin family protein [Candidatus Omnitrophica bacterium]|nr:nucleotidyl transferase AbiEii/AbiGii toxin family protein [Candidatus Omnitrophota bacterium]